MVECPECGAGADLTPDKQYAHCATCNNIFQPGKEGSGEKGSGSGSGDKSETDADANANAKAKESGSAAQTREGQ